MAGSGGGQEPQWNRGSLRLRGILRAAAGVSLKLSPYTVAAVPKTYMNMYMYSRLVA